MQTLCDFFVVGLKKQHVLNNQTGIPIESHPFTKRIDGLVRKRRNFIANALTHRYCVLNKKREIL